MMGPKCVWGQNVMGPKCVLAKKGPKCVGAKMCLGPKLAWGQSVFCCYGAKMCGPKGVRAKLAGPNWEAAHFYAIRDGDATIKAKNAANM